MISAAGGKIGVYTSWAVVAFGVRHVRTKNTIVIHTNEHEHLAALVAQYSHTRLDPHSQSYTVRLLTTAEFKNLERFDGRTFVRQGRESGWYLNAPQGFLPLRMAVPQLMDFQGKALLTDPDVFAVQSAATLFELDFSLHDIYTGYLSSGTGRSTSVMVLNCEALSHWHFEQQMESMFQKHFDGYAWITLELENQSRIGELDAAWNSLDQLGPDTRMVHMTNQRTQPWKTGLRYDQRKMGNHLQGRRLLSTLHKSRGYVRGSIEYVLLAYSSDRYLPHPDPNQEKFFFALLKEAVQTGAIESREVQKAVRRGFVRKDIFRCISDAPSCVNSFIKCIR